MAAFGTEALDSILFRMSAGSTHMGGNMLVQTFTCSAAAVAASSTSRSALHRIRPPLLVWAGRNFRSRVSGFCVVLPAAIHGCMAHLCQVQHRRCGGAAAAARSRRLTCRACPQPDHRHFNLPTAITVASNLLRAAAAELPRQLAHSGGMLVLFVARRVREFVHLTGERGCCPVSCQRPARPMHVSQLAAKCAQRVGR